MIIMKFGGSSLANAERMRHVRAIIEQHLHERPVVVLSAIGKTTDNLITAAHQALEGIVDTSAIEQLHTDIARELGLDDREWQGLVQELNTLLMGISLVKELSPRTLDHLLAFGERLSVRVFSAFLNQQGTHAKPFDGWEAGIITSSNHNRAEVLPESYQAISKALGGLDIGVTPIVTGFIGKDSSGAITTLGRGGSDLTAAVLGAALTAREIQVWKDVHGIMTTDPRLVTAPHPVPQMTFQEAEELAYFGAKVLHPCSIQPAMRKNIPVRVKNSYAPEHPGTVITAEPLERDNPVVAITCKRGQVMVHLTSTRMLGQYGFLARVFQLFADLRISVDVIATSEVSISMTLDKHQGVIAQESQLADISNVHIVSGRSIVSLVGGNSRSALVLEHSLNALSREGIEVQMISHGASQLNTSLVVDDADAQRSVRLLHEQFFSRSLS